MILEKARVGEEVYANGKKVFNSMGANICGEVEVLHSSSVDGRPIFTKGLYHNDLLVTGSVFMEEKINGMRSSFKTVPLDLEQGVHAQDEIIVDSTTIKDEKICGIMIGNGGCGDTYNTVYKVNRAARSVPGMIPFRVVPVTEDLSVTDRAKYFMRVVRGDMAYYYGKKFDTERSIEVEFEDGTVVPVDVDSIVTNKFIKVYSRYQVTIDKRDVREMFKLTQGSTLRSLINSVGLLTGYSGKATDGAEEFFNVRGLTTANMENQELKDSESTIKITYRLLIQ